MSFLENRGDASFFEPAPGIESEEIAPGDSKPSSTGTAYHLYDVKVDGRSYRVEVSDAGHVQSALPVRNSVPESLSGGGGGVSSSLAGNVFKVLLPAGSVVEQGQAVIVLEAMKMETEVNAPKSGSVSSVFVNEGDTVEVGDLLFAID